MKIDKYVLCFQTGIDKVAKRMGFTRPPSPVEIVVLYALKRCPSSTYMGLLRFIHARRNMDPKSFAKSFEFLNQNNLVQRDGRIYSLTPVGHEYLASVRRYLLNIRL